MNLHRASCLHEYLLRDRTPASILWCRLSRLDPFSELSTELVTSCVECCVRARDFGRNCLRCIPDFAGYKISGKRVGRRAPKRAVRISSDASITAPPFSPRTLRATVAGFDGIAWSHASATQRWPFIRRRGRGVCTVHAYFSSFFLRFSTVPSSSALDIAAPPPW